MKTSSAKAKGRKLQQWFRDVLIEELKIHEEDIESRSMGAGGEDLIMARAAREKFPYSIEYGNFSLAALAMVKSSPPAPILLDSISSS